MELPAIDREVDRVFAEFRQPDLLDQNHDLLGEGFNTDLKAYASAYYYDFETDSTGSGRRYANGAVLLGGLRFSFF